MRLILFSVCIYLGTISRTRKFFFLSLCLYTKYMVRYLPCPPANSQLRNVYRYWQTFDPYVKPLLDREMDLRRFNELDTSKEVRVVTDESVWDKVKEHQTY